MEKTYYPKPGEITKEWVLVDANDQNLGRLATQLARLLLGKHKPQFTPGVDTGDYVVVVNAERIRVTGKKMTDKIYYRHSGYPGGLKEMTLEEMMDKYPTRVVETAVRGMLPKTHIGRTMYKKLKVYEGESHPHKAQVMKSGVTEGGNESS